MSKVWLVAANEYRPMIAYPTAEKAEQALRAGEIQAYYVVSADYLSSRRVTMVYITPPGDSVYGQFWDFLRINQLTDLPPAIARCSTGDAHPL